MLLDDFPDVPKRAILSYYWSYPGAKLLDVVTPNGWLSILSKYLPREDVISPGLTDLESTGHDTFQYEDKIFEENQRLRGKESKYNVIIKELRTMIS